MKRKVFFKDICKYGLCSCAAFAWISSEKVYASADDQDEEVKNLKWRLEFINKRFDKLLGIMNASLDESKKREILEKLGRECAKDLSDSFIKYKGNIEGFLEDAKKKWVERAEYEKEKGIIRISDRKRDTCFCPFIGNSPESSDTLCHCSIGWQKEIYETLTGRPVEVEITESVLKGGERCSFNIILG